MSTLFHAFSLLLLLIGVVVVGLFPRTPTPPPIIKFVVVSLLLPLPSLLELTTFSAALLLLSLVGFGGVG